MGVAADIRLDAPWVGRTFVPPTPIDTQSLTRRLIAAIKDLPFEVVTLGQNIEVVEFPAHWQEYRLVHRVGAALITYMGSHYDESEDTGIVLQERTMTWQVVVIVRDLGWALGQGPSGTSPGSSIYIDTLRQGLTGYLIPGCTRKTRPTSDDFVGHDKQGGVFVWAMTFEAVAINVEQGREPNFPALTDAVAIETGGITTMQAAPAVYTFSSQDQISLEAGNVWNVVVSQIGSGTPYQLGADYAVDGVSGVISRNPAGAIGSLASVDISFSFADVFRAISNGGTAPTAPHN